MTGGVALVSELWYTLEEQKEQEKRKADAEKMARDAELYQLRQQLQPHFLFNSLNSISALVSFKPAEARRMIQQLSEKNKAPSKTGQRREPHAVRLGSFSRCCCAQRPVLLQARYPGNGGNLPGGDRLLSAPTA